jgi:hypothetical protein
MEISQSLYHPSEDIFYKMASKNPGGILMGATRRIFQTSSLQINAGAYFHNLEIRLHILTLKQQVWTANLTK